MIATVGAHRGRGRPRHDALVPPPPAATEESLETQISLLRLVRRWAFQRVHEMREGRAIRGASVSRVAAAHDTPAAFVLRLGASHALRWTLRPGRGRDRGRWHIAVSVLPEPSRRWTGYPRPRTPHTWSRELVDAVIARLLASYQRALQPPVAVALNGAGLASS